MYDINYHLTGERSKRPHVFNIETTNACNMRCVMCPRTDKMTRAVTTMDMDTFCAVVDQVRPYRMKDLVEFYEARLKPGQSGEDMFDTYAIANHLMLHGYGEPLLDKHIVERVAACTALDIPTYFSCVPANLMNPWAETVLIAGLDVVKFSIDAMTDEGQRKVRGKHNDFTQSLANILEFIALKKKLKAQTQIVITMIDMGQSEQTKQAFLDVFGPLDAFVYIKSQDNRWHSPTEAENKSAWQANYCKAPWASLSVMAGGEVVPCHQDYNAEMSFGNVRDVSLEEIWNSHEYNLFRGQHQTGMFPDGHKCNERCDLRKAYQCV